MALSAFGRTALGSKSLRIAGLKAKAKAALSQEGRRTFHQAATKSFHYSNDYIHAPTMYNLQAMKHRKLKFGLLVFGGIGVGTVIPLLACSHQQKKALGAAPEEA